MSKVRTVHRCSECGAGFPKWAGKCGSCGAWNTLIEEVDVAVPSRGAAVRVAAEPAQPITTVDVAHWAAVSTGIAEFDRVLGGGLVPGSVTLVGGEPGIGKSTLLLQLLGAGARAGRRSLLVSGEESVQQVRLRAERLGAVAPELWIVAETNLDAVLEHVRVVKPEVCVVDSIQTLSDPQLTSAPGTVSQVRDCANALARLAKELGVAMIFVGHVTKDGTLAGPRVLEHLVDTVLAFEGDRHHHLRMVRAVKHRFGATGELGLFEMLEQGLVAVADPSSLLLADRQKDVPGSVLVPVIEGNRPLMVEVQGLVAQSAMAMPRRVAQGFDNNRLAVLLAVIERRVGIKVGFADVFVSVIGGVRIIEPAADLAVALAVLSSAADEPVHDGLVAIGEVGLSGEIRQVSHYSARLAEAARLGATSAIVPASSPQVDVKGITVHRAANLHEAAAFLGVLRSGNKRTTGGNRRPVDSDDGRPVRNFRSTELNLRRGPRPSGDDGEMPWIDEPNEDEG
jgi:DNA repair protein RadA/Sms